MGYGFSKVQYQLYQSCKRKTLKRCFLSLVNHSCLVWFLHNLQYLNIRDWTSVKCPDGCISLPRCWIIFLSLSVTTNQTIMTWPHLIFYPPIIHQTTLSLTFYILNISTVFYLKTNNKLEHIVLTVLLCGWNILFNWNSLWLNGRHWSFYQINMLN